MNDEKNTPGNEASRLGTQSIAKLLLVFSIPAVTSNIVTAIYNVVARIFVGRGIEEAALGGLSLVMPIMTIVLAFPILFGVGTANLISIRLGEKRKELAEAAANHCIWMAIVAGIAVSILGHIFLDPMLSILGAQEGSISLGYGREYIRIILYGSVFQFLGMSLANIIRSQGFPTGAMAGLLISVSINLALQYPFIYTLRLGVTGSALATVIAQASMAAFYIIFLRVTKTPVTLSPFRFRVSFRIMGEILTFGSSQAVAHFAMAYVIALFNERASYFGEMELAVAHGGDAALSGMTIASTVTMIVNMIVFGLSMGAQPIIGYNYGAKQLKRVRKAYTTAVLFATGTAVVGFVIMFFFAEPLVYLFAPDGSKTLIDFSTTALRIMSIGLPVVGFQIISSNYFVAVGRPKTALFLSLSRQVIFVIPIIYLLSNALGLIGVIIAGPAADFISSFVAAIVILHTFRKQRLTEAE